MIKLIFLGLSKRKGRCAAHFPSKWGSEPLEVSVNELNQYISKDHALLSTALGNLARMENLLPLNYEKWSDMPRSRLDDVWNEVQANTTLPIGAKDYVLKNLNSLWKDWKKEVEAKHFTPHKDDPEYFVVVRDDRLEPSQWFELVTYWKTPKVLVI
ncbi:hypothetical protein BUALT_Bualt16G0065600 [Buddleja alternifolia]|uniref:Uncharacterized protein n=1 Tax=Buddleja alternifolia TaxID=168488 RepID=A0AAV6W7D3_9LAMI|nr:hypothetical protein BUALT_Bualt16G0065600 [Buddleja alternifolia]